MITCWMSEGMSEKKDKENKIGPQHHRSSGGDGGVLSPRGRRTPNVTDTSKPT